MNTQLSQKTISKAYPTKTLQSILEIILLIGIGAVGVLLHAKFRMPLRMPGHWGIVFMALLFSGRLFSKKPYAASLSSIGAVSMLLLPLGFKDPLMPVLYVFPGYIVDFLYYFFKNRSHKVIFFALTTGLAYMTIPVLRIIITVFTGYIYGSFITGYFYPIIMHFIFGATGGLIAMGACKLIRNKK